LRIETYFIPVPIETHIAVIIDVLRATSMACALFEAGISELVMVPTVEEALEWKKKGYLAAGERGALKIKGFDLGNSPTELTKQEVLSKVRGRSVVMTTTNGTRAVNEAKASLKILACLNNLPSVVKHLKPLNPKKISIICAGTQMRISMEDVYCAGLLVNTLRDEITFKADMDDASHLAMLVARHLTLKDLKETEHAKRLASKGFEADLTHAFRVGTSSVVPLADRANVFHTSSKM